MKREITVPLAIFVPIGLWFMAYAVDMSRLDYHRIPLVTEASMIVFGLAGVRLAVLWIQTVIDAASSAPGRRPRWGWIIAMIVAGPVASCLYYMLVLPVPEDVGSRASSPAQDDAAERRVDSD